MCSNFKLNLKALTSLILVLVLAFSLVACGKADKDDKLILGFVPLIEQEKLIESVEPLSEILTEKIGTEVEAFTAANYVGVVEALGSGQVDFAIIPPFAYVLAHKESGAEVLLSAVNKNGESSYRSELVVKKDAGIRSVADLKGKRIAFVDPSSSSGYIYPAAFLINSGLDLDNDVQTIFAGGHDAAMQALVNGDVDLACTYEGLRNKLVDDFPTILEDTVVLTYTDDIPYIALVVRNDLPEELKQRIRDGVLDGLNDGAGNDLIIELFNLYGFVPATDADYDPIRRVSEVMDIDLD